MNRIFSDTTRPMCNATCFGLLIVVIIILLIGFVIITYYVRKLRIQSRNSCENETNPANGVQLPVDTNYRASYAKPTDVTPVK